MTLTSLVAVSLADFYHRVYDSDGCFYEFFSYILR